jgi:hypothetical protein
MTKHQSPHDIHLNFLAAPAELVIPAIGVTEGDHQK